jgi:hypothetical protein
VVNFNPGRFTPGKEPRYPLKRRLGGPQSRSGHFGKERNGKDKDKFALVNQEGIIDIAVNFHTFHILVLESNMKQLHHPEDATIRKRSLVPIGYRA